MVIERDAVTGRVTRVESQPHDTPQALDLIAEILRAEQAAAPHSTGTAKADAPAPAVSILPVGNPKGFVGDSITDYIAHLERKNKHSKNTLHDTWGPSLRIFRELIAEKRRPLARGLRRDLGHPASVHHAGPDRSIHGRLMALSDAPGQEAGDQ